MVELSPRLLAIGVVLLYVIAILLWITGELAIAGLSFLAASLLIYYRETRT